MPKGVVDAQTNTSKSDTAEEKASEKATESKHIAPAATAKPTTAPSNRAKDSPESTKTNAETKTTAYRRGATWTRPRSRSSRPRPKSELATENSESAAEVTAAEPVAVETSVVAPVSEPSPEPDPVTEANAPAAVAVAKVMTTLLNPLAAPVDNDAPVDSPGLWTLLAFVRREFQSTFFNTHPTANPIITSQTDDVVTGNIGAVDPDGDRLTYTVIGRGPALGRVSIDQSTGAFTYTPVVDFSVLGGSDRFTVEISDEAGLHLHGLASLWEVPVNLIRGIPVIGSLLSDFLPRTSQRPP